MGAWLREQYGQLACEVQRDGVPPHFAVRFPAASMPYQVVVVPVTDARATSFVHVETLVAEAVDWTEDGLAHALLRENQTYLFARYARHGDRLVSDYDLPGACLDSATLAVVVNAVAEVAVAGHDLLDAAGFLLDLTEQE